MMIPEQLSRAVLPWGTTTICTDPHEIGNVMGIEGVEFMLENAKKSALRQYVLAPSCVPAVPGLESSGASFEAPEIRTLLEKEGVIGIAEIMDFVGVYKDSPRMHAIIDEGLKKNAFLPGPRPHCHRQGAVRLPPGRSGKRSRKPERGGSAGEAPPGHACKRAGKLFMRCSSGFDPRSGRTQMVRSRFLLYRRCPCQRPAG